MRPQSKTKSRLESQKDLERLIRSYALRVTENFGRVKSLINLSETRDAHTKQDVLRAAVVFLHATIEDLLRFLGSACLPRAGADVLNRIGFVLGDDRLADKIQLGTLSRHRGKTVDELIDNSVSAHLDRRSFSSTNDIATHLADCGFPTIPRSDEIYPKLSQMIQRRHAIVHRADRVQDPDGTFRTSPIDRNTVLDWEKAGVALFSVVIVGHILQEDSRTGIVRAALGEPT